MTVHVSYEVGLLVGPRGGVLLRSDAGEGSEAASMDFGLCKGKIHGL